MKYNIWFCKEVLYNTIIEIVSQAFLFFVFPHPHMTTFITFLNKFEEATVVLRTNPSLHFDVWLFWKESTATVYCENYNCGKIDNIAPSVTSFTGIGVSIWQFSLTRYWSVLPKKKWDGVVTSEMSSNRSLLDQD